MADRNERWIEDMLSGTEDLRKASAPPFLYTRIVGALDSTPVVRSSKVRLAIVAAALLMLLNAGTLYFVSDRTADTTLRQTQYSSGDLSLDAFGTN